MSSPIGGGVISGSPVDPFRFDVRDYGAKAIYGFDNAPAFQAAVDAAAAKVRATLATTYWLLPKVIVHIPATDSPYYVGGPVYVDESYIEIHGDGPGTNVFNYGGVCSPIFVLGLKRTPTVMVDGQPRVLAADANYRPDCFGKLDNSVTSGTGQRWGFRSHGESFIVSHASPLSAGTLSPASGCIDNWADTRKLTIEFAVEGFAGGKLSPDIQILGSGNRDKNALYPFKIATTYQGNQIRLHLSTQEVQYGPLTCYFADMPLSTTTGVQRLTWQIDLDSGLVTGYADGNQVFASTSLGPGWRPGLRFAENQGHPFAIAEYGGIQAGGFYSPNGYDFALYGLSLSNSIRYQNTGINTPQKRADQPGTAINDAYRYFGNSVTDPGFLCALDFSENPALKGRHLSVRSPYGNASAFICHSYTGDFAGTSNNAIRNMRISGGRNYGTNIVMGQVGDLTLSGVRSESSFYGAASLPCAVSYIVRAENCMLSGGDAGFFSIGQIVWMRDITFGVSGRASMRFYGGAVDAERLFVYHWSTNSQSTISIHNSDTGGNYSFKYIHVDFEGESYGRAAFYCERHPYTPGTSLRLQDVILGTVGNVPAIALRDSYGPGAFQPATLIADNFLIYGSTFGSVVEVDGPSWRGEVRNLAAAEDNSRVRNLGTFGTETGVIVRDRRKAPPRTRPWVAGGHVLDVPAPTDGQFAEWRCVAGGAYGTPTPPVWSGLHPLASRPGALAGYVVNHGYITVALS